MRLSSPFTLKITLLVMSVIVLFIAATIGINGEAGNGLGRFIGRLHVLVLHFPVTLLLLAPCLSILNNQQLLPNSEPVIRLVWWFGSLSVFVTVCFGMLLAANEGHSFSDVQNHMLGGICVALLAFIATALFESRLFKQWQKIAYAVVSGLLAFMIFVAAHAGGNLVHGDTYLTRFAPEPIGTWIRGAQHESQNNTKSAEPDDPMFTKEIKPLLTKYCFDCHGNDIQKGGIQLDNLDPDFINGHDAPNWHAALDMLNSGEMPPKRKLQPTDEERRILVNWLTEGIQTAKEVKKGQSKQVIRRLTKQQYSNTLKDLLGIDINFGNDLPDDPLSHIGFSNSGEVLQSSTLHLEKFASIARTALNKAIDPEQKPKVHHYRMNFGTGIGKGEPYSESQGYLDEPVSPQDIFVDIKGSATDNLTDQQLSKLKRHFSSSMRGSFKQHFKIQPSGVDLFSALPHKESAEDGKPGFWNAPSPNLSMQIKDKYPLTGQFKVKIKASKSSSFDVMLPMAAQVNNIQPLVELDEQYKPILNPNLNTVASAKTKFLASGFVEEHNNSDFFKTTEEDGQKDILIFFKLPEDQANFYQVDFVYKGLATDSQFELVFDFRHKVSVTIPAEKPDNVGKILTTTLAGTYFTGRNHSVNVMSNSQIPSFSDVVLTKVSSDAPLVTQLPIKIVTNPVSESKEPVLLPYVGTRMDDGVDYALLRPVTVNNTEPRVFEFTGRLENYPIPPIGNIGDNITSSSLKIGVWNDDKVKSKTQAGSVLNVEYIEFEAPYFETWPTQSHRNIFIDSKLDKESKDYAHEVIFNFANRAFRRPITREELNPFFKFYDKVAPEFDRFEDGVKEALIAILCSPQFLYLAEPFDESLQNEKEQLTKTSPSPFEQLATIFGISSVSASFGDNNDNRVEIDEFALATRIAYFIWNSPPDSELLSLAAKGQLRQQLPEQLSRMIKDTDKLNRFVSVFVTEWLRLDRQQLITVDVDTYPDYTRFVKQDMATETKTFVQTLIQQNLSALNLIDSDFALLNQNLAEFYGIVGVKGNEFRPVRLPDKVSRGGLLSQGAFLTGHADGVHSHPVKRAVWIKSKILGDEPPAPPPNVPDLDPQTSGFENLTLKQQLEKHRDKESCRDCHSKLDPYGIVFENYDAVGRYRAEYKGSPIDSVAILPDGTEVNGIAAIKTYLLTQKKEQVMASVIKHLFAYALGKEVSFHDEDELDSILKQVQEDDYKMQSLILAIVRSPSFNKI